MTRKLTKRQHGCLVEALRRHTRFNMHDLNKPLTEAWTGLGSMTDYKPALDAGLMVYANSPHPGFSTWWKLTIKGALIVAYWLGQGFNFEKVENGIRPDLTLPDL